MAQIISVIAQKDAQKGNDKFKMIAGLLPPVQVSTFIHMNDLPAPTTQLIDPFERMISYLRLSVTDRCDLRCRYCMSENMKFLPKKNLLSLSELERLCNCFISLGINKLRITGGEPLVRRNIMDFFKAMGRHVETGHLKELTLTTNGTQLEKYAQPLADIGIKRINVSLDTLDPAKFTHITRWGQLKQVRRGIDAARNAGIRIKINAVALKGFNEDEVFNIIEWCAQEDMALTWIEVMPMGELEEASRLSQFYSLADLRRKIETRYELIDTDERTGGPARYVRVAQTNQSIGFITPLSNNFCDSCNRIRVTCEGQLFMCLGQENNISLRDIMRQNTLNDDALIAAIKGAISNKPKSHSFDYSNDKIKGQMTRHMSHTGG